MFDEKFRHDGRFPLLLVRFGGGRLGLVGGLRLVDADQDGDEDQDQPDNAESGDEQTPAEMAAEPSEGDDEGDVQAVLDTLDFGRDSPASQRAGDRRSRRERKPSRPLPPL